jgi:hypothetical protein
MPVQAKFALASSAFCGMILRYYGGIFPFIVGGKIVRLVKKPMGDRFNMQRLDSVSVQHQWLKLTSLSQLEKLDKKSTKPMTTEVTKSA